MAKLIYSAITSLDGGGKRSLPDDLRLELELVDERRISGGMVHLGYRARI